MVTSVAKCRLIWKTFLAGLNWSHRQAWDRPLKYCLSSPESTRARSTQRAVLQNSCSAMGILLGKLIQFYVLLVRWKTFAGRHFKKTFCEMGIIAAKWQIVFRTLDNLWKFAEIGDVHGETHIIHSCYCSWLGEILVPSSWEWRTPFNLPENAVIW